MAASSTSADSQRRWRTWLYASQLLLWIISIAAGCLLLILLVQIELFGEWQLDHSAAFTAPEATPHVGVLDVNLRRIYTDPEAEVVLTTWEAFLGGLDVSPHRVGALHEESLAATSVLLVPTLHGLTPLERDQLAAAVEGGVNVLIGASAPLHDDEAMDLRSEFWRTWLGVSARDVQTMRQETFLRPPVNSPFDASWTPGDGVRFRPGMRVIRMSADETVPLTDQNLLPIHHGELGIGRWVHLGFDPTTIPAGDDTLPNVSTMLIGSLHWLQRKPSFEVSHWPAGHDNAILISGLIEGNDEVPRQITSTLKAQDIGVTWFVEAERHPDAELPNYGEVAVWGVPPMGPDPDAREVRDAVTGAAQSVRALGAQISGYSPRTYGMSEAELQGAANARLDYVFASALQRGDAPEVRSVPTSGWLSGPRPVVLLPRTLPDDIAITIDSADGTPDAIFGWYERELVRRASMQSLQQVTVRSRTLSQVGTGAALQKMIAALPRERTWMPTAAELATWWRQRDGVRVVVEADVPHRLLVRVSNVGNELVEDLEVTVHLPQNARTAEARLVHWRRTLGTQYTLVHEPGSSVARLQVQSVPPGSNEALFITWE